MIKTKYLVTEQDFFTNTKEIDELINHFIKNNPDIEIIDIKYQSNVAVAIYKHSFCRTYDISALIIYKEN